MNESPAHLYKMPPKPLYKMTRDELMEETLRKRFQEQTFTVPRPTPTPNPRVEYLKQILLQEKVK